MFRRFDQAPILTPEQLDFWKTEGYLIWGKCQEYLVDEFNWGYQRLSEVEETPNRTHSLHTRFHWARQLFGYAGLNRVADELLEQRSDPLYSIAFYRGSQQRLHQDQWVFAVDPPEALLGCWIALEDILPDSGPLVYYPKSHKDTTTWEQFQDYPRKNLKNSTREVFEDYTEKLELLADNYERKEFLAKKGDCLFWHPLLIHGGSPHVSAGSSRKSFVIHYVGQGCDRSNQLAGPYLW